MASIQSVADATAPFASLAEDTRALVREKQRQRKLEKQAAKAAKRQARAAEAREDPDHGSDRDYSDRLSKEAYFSACRRGILRDPQLPPTLHSVDLLMQVLAAGDEQAKRIGSFNYFQFEGSERQIWDPTLLARLAHEGFFTITTSRFGAREPLPELQPFYGVLTWPNFAASKYVRHAVARLRQANRGYCLVNGRDPMRTWARLDAYHTRVHGSNWLTKQYFAMNRLASADDSVNFRLHCVELYAEEDIDKDGSVPLAGEIGFSVGRVYTSLSGWTEERTSEALGTAQLVLLGRWLERRGYAFWSLGHCYSPEMEYKRQLGHRIYPRNDFLALLRQHRGDFRSTPSCVLDADVFTPLQEGERCSSESLLCS